MEKSVHLIKESKRLFDMAISKASLLEAVVSFSASLESGRHCREKIICTCKQVGFEEWFVLKLGLAGVKEISHVLSQGNSK